MVLGENPGTPTLADAARIVTFGGGMSVMKQPLGRS